MFRQIILLSMFACAPEVSELRSYQARVANNYRYLLTHTARLDGTTVDHLDKEISDFDSYGQCFYRVVSEQKLRLHRPDNLRQALATATKVNDNYLPLSTIKKMIERDRTLQELYTSERHWLLPTVGAFVALPVIYSIDMLLHKGNGIIVDNSQQQIVDKLVKGDKSLRREIYEVLHLTAKVEHDSDSLVQQMITIGGNVRKSLRKALVNSPVGDGFANLTKNKCIGKRAALCLVGYLAFFNSLFTVGLPVLSDRVANSLARFFNRDREQTTLQTLLNDRESLTQTQATSDKVVKTFEKKIKGQQVTDTASCPEPTSL